MHARAKPERPKQSTALPSENGPTLMSALGAEGDHHCGRTPAATTYRSSRCDLSDGPSSIRLK